MSKVWNKIKEIFNKIDLEIFKVLWKIDAEKLVHLFMGFVIFLVTNVLAEFLFSRSIVAIGIAFIATIGITIYKLIRDKNNPKSSGKFSETNLFYSMIMPILLSILMLLDRLVWVL